MKASTLFRLGICTLTFALVFVLARGQKSPKSDEPVTSIFKTNHDEDTRRAEATDINGNSNRRNRLRSPVGRENSRSAAKGKKRRQRKGRKNGAAKNQDDASHDIIRETMIHMFGFNHMPSGRKSCDNERSDCQETPSGFMPPSSTDEQSSLGRQFKPNPPNFMLELYQTYSKDNDLMMLHTKSQGNTVRSFFPRPAHSPHNKNFGKSVTMIPVPSLTDRSTPTSAFLFNVSSIPALEDLVAAEIRVDGTAANSQTTEAVVSVYRVQESDCADEIDCTGNPMRVFKKVGQSLLLNSPTERSRWSDPRLVKMAQKARKFDHVVVLKYITEVEASLLQRQRRHFESRRRRLRDLPNAFTTRDNNANRQSKRDASPVLDVNPSSVIPMLIVYCNDPRSESPDETSITAPVIWRALGNITTSGRKKVKRSASLPEDMMPSDDTAGASNTSSSSKRPRDAPARNEPRLVQKRKDPARRRKKNVQLAGSRNSTASEDHSRERPSKNPNRGGRRGGKRRKNRKNGKIDIKLHPSVDAERDDENCGRKSLHVKFEDIGWSDWIISPKYFDAYYCSGLCKLQQMQASHSTNHAIIQSVVKTIAGHKNVPAPCCVPDKLISLSVLFFDEDKNVVLKVFPNMSVETCACR